MLEPDAALIPTPQRPATVLPSEAPAVLDNGFPNILADSATVAGQPRPAEAVERAEARVAAQANATEAAVSALPPPSFASDLARRGRGHVAEARRAIEASGSNRQDVRELPAAAATPRAPLSEAPSRPIDPGAPPPRTVGVPTASPPSE